MDADDDGKARFVIAHSATKSWGTILSLDCVLNGTAAASYQVNLNDSSTYQLLSEAELAPTKTGVRPPLTGDLSAISTTQLSQGHYPFRPDTNQPERYAQWVQMVTRPVDQYRPMPITLLGTSMGGPFVASLSLPKPNPWSGFIQSAGGFNFQHTNCCGNYPFANTTVPYGGYEAYAYAPLVNQGCGLGTPNNCSDTAFWVGLGGYQTAPGQAAPAILQNGFELSSFLAQQLLFMQFFPGSPRIFQSVDINGNFHQTRTALFYLLGYGGDAGCTYTSTAWPTNGCFIWEDLTDNWTIYGWLPYPRDMNGQPLAQWVPVTAEYISEWQGGLPGSGGGFNQDYIFDEMVGGALDGNGTWHYDPGNASATDPYVLMTGVDSSGSACADVVWNSGGYNNPVDPMLFYPLSCGPN